MRWIVALAIALLAIVGIVTGAALVMRGESASVPEVASVGPNPTLPEPTRSLLPTIDIALVKGWSGGEKPTPAPGLEVTAFVSGLDHPRWLFVLPNGDVLVAESNGPPRPQDGKGVKGATYHFVQGLAGAGVPSANRISLIRPMPDGGVPPRTTFLKDLNSPFGMALVGTDLFVANTDAVMRFHYTDGMTEITAPGEKVVDLPAGPINHHWTKSLLASRDGNLLYATVGSNSNIGENGLANEGDRASILEINPRTGGRRVFASGLRNPNGLGWEPQTGQLWAVVNERDELGSDLVPDYLTSVKEGAFYGWPYSYWGRHVDPRVPANPDLVATPTVPDYSLGSHVAPLGLAFYDGEQLGSRYKGGAFIGEHGSWNRKPRSGYKVIFVPFSQGRPSGAPVDILTGFVGPTGARGRPVGIAVDKAGALLVADDIGNTIWRVVATAGMKAASK